MNTEKFPYLILVLICVLGVMSYRIYPSQAAQSDQTVPDMSRSYSSGRYGISFLYPRSYSLKEEDIGPTEPPHHRVNLYASDNQLALSIDIIENEGRYATAADLSLDMTGFMRANGYLGRGIVASMVRRGYIYILTSPKESVRRQTVDGIEKSLRLSE